jgi:hypothetical protein
MHHFLAPVTLIFGLILDSVGTVSGTRPNIVFVITDDRGFGDLSCTGNLVLRRPEIIRKEKGKGQAEG